MRHLIRTAAVAGLLLALAPLPRPAWAQIVGET